jgi:hypothetical protein
MSLNSTLLHADPIDYRHQCLIYQGSPSQKLPMLAQILKSKLEEGYRCLYLNSAPMVAGMRSTLAALDVDIAEVTKERLLLSCEPVSGSTFDSEAMLTKLEGLLDLAINEGYKGLWASGDMTWEFGPSRDFTKLMEYELGLEELFRRRTGLCGICQYHIDTLPADAVRQSLLIHPSIVINETLRIVNPHYLKSTTPYPDPVEKLDEMVIKLAKNE